MQRAVTWHDAIFFAVDPSSTVSNYISIYDLSFAYVKGCHFHAVRSLGADGIETIPIPESPSPSKTVKALKAALEKDCTIFASS